MGRNVIERVIRGAPPTPQVTEKLNYHQTMKTNLTAAPGVSTAKQGCFILVVWQVSKAFHRARSVHF